MRNIDKLTIENMDVFFPLTQKKDLITRVSKEYLNGRLLDLGCGTMPYKNIILENSNVVEYTGVDIENPIYQTHNKPDFFWDLPGQPGSSIAQWSAGFEGRTAPRQPEPGKPPRAGSRTRFDIST